MKPEEFYEKEFGNADSVPKESVIRLLSHFAKVLEMEREAAISKQKIRGVCNVNLEKWKL